MGSRKQKWLAAILIAVLAITATTGAVYAYLSATTAPVENTFTVAPTHTIDIEETFTTAPGGLKPLKQNVCVDVGNPGYAVYVRVAIVVTWKNDKNEVYGQAPVVGTDYTISLNVGGNTPWFQGSDGYYYLESMVVSGNTPVLINTCSLTSGANIPDGYDLHVEIIAQTIQAKGGTDADNTPAVEDAWKVVTVADDGTLITVPET